MAAHDCLRLIFGLYDAVSSHGTLKLCYPSLADDDPPLEDEEVVPALEDELDEVPLESPPEDEPPSLPPESPPLRS